MKVVGWISTVLLAGAVLGAVVVGAGASKDVKRYMRMRRM